MPQKDEPVRPRLTLTPNLGTLKADLQKAIDDLMKTHCPGVRLRTKLVTRYDIYESRAVLFQCCKDVGFHDGRMYRGGRCAPWSGCQGTREIDKMCYQGTHCVGSFCRVLASLGVQTKATRTIEKKHDIFYHSPCFPNALQYAGYTILGQHEVRIVLAYEIYCAKTARKPALETKARCRSYRFMGFIIVPMCIVDPSSQCHVKRPFCPLYVEDVKRRVARQD